MKLLKAFCERIQNFEAGRSDCLERPGTSSVLAEVFERKTDNKERQEREGRVGREDGEENIRQEIQEKEKRYGELSAQNL